MHLRLILITSATLAVVGCSSSPKASNTAATPNASAAAPAVAAAQKPAVAPVVEIQKAPVLACLRGGEERKVDIEGLKPQGCEVYYTTQGNRNKVAWSQTGKNHCETVRDRIRGNLETAGFKCADQKDPVAQAPAKPAVQLPEKTAAQPAVTAPKVAPAVQPAVAQPKADIKSAQPVSANQPVKVDQKEEKKN